MKLFVYSAAAALLFSAGTASAVAKPSKGQNVQLRDTLNSIALEAAGNDKRTPPGQAKRPSDPDMGDDNAARQAILTVCYKNTPAAQRSAICDREPVSPQ